MRGAGCVDGEQEKLDAAINQMADLDMSTCEEKAHAALALAAVARAARHHLADFVDDAIRVLHAVCVAFQPAIRQAAFPALAACVSASVLAFSKPIQQSGPPSAVSTVLHAATESHADAAIVTCMLALDDDADAETVARAFDCLSSVTHDVGWSFLHVYLARLSCLLASLFPPCFPLPPNFLSSHLLSSALLKARQTLHDLLPQDVARMLHRRAMPASCPPPLSLRPRAPGFLRHVV